ncbi:MAG: hypothetical protein FWD09_01265 [Lentimicrobiaceae bacterium]|nr:hypothetical protein [Lentimicrobiaceae bacterium]
MNRILLLSSLILFPFLTYSQPKINKITWVGENKEHLNISKKTASLQKGMEFQEFKVIKYVKNNYIILSETQYGVEFKQKYNIVRFTNDTLILAPEKTDYFKLSEANEQHQYVFTNSMLTYKFVSIYYETSFYNFDNPKDRLRFILYIDSAKNSRVVIQDQSFNEGAMYTAPPSKVEYEHLIKILSSCDLSNCPEEDMEVDKESPYQILEISYNDQVKNIRGLPSASFAEELGYFVREYIELRANITAPWGWSVAIRRRK